MGKDQVRSRGSAPPAVEASPAMRTGNSHARGVISRDCQPLDKQALTPPAELADWAGLDSGFMRWG